MIRNYILFAFLGLLIVSCSSDDLRNPSETFQDGEVISNDEITLRRGGELNGSYLQILNHPIQINNLSNTSTSSRSGAGTYTAPNLNHAIDLTSLSGVIVPELGKTYFIPEGTTFSGVLSFMHPATIYVLGTWEGNTFPVSVPSGGKVIVAPTGKMNAAHFSIYNIGAVLENFGETYYTSSTLTGEIYNYSEIHFTSPNIQLFPDAIIQNHCQMNFHTFTRIENDLYNFGTMDFNGGFIIQSPSGHLILERNTVVNINSNEGSYNSGIKSDDTSYARINVANGARLKSTHGLGVISGLIDVNGNVSESELNLENGATVNGNIYIPGSTCVLEQGEKDISCETELNLILVANVLSPVMENITLSATDVKVKDQKTYISYHTNDEFYGNSPFGSLRIIDITSNSNPQLTYQVEFNNMEFNGVDVVDNHLYAIGGNKAGGGLVDVPLSSNGEFTTNLNDFNTTKLQNISGKNTYVNNGSLWLTSGSINGGIYELDITNDFEVKNHISLDRRSKYIAQNSHSQAAMSLDSQGVTVRIANRDGSNARLYQYNNINPDVVTGKNVIDMDEDFVYLALSDKGVAKVRLSDGELVNTFEPNNYRVNGRKIFNKNGLTNGVAVGGCYLYLANGNDGVIILDKDTFKVAGSFELDQSSNYVYISDQLLYVATGRDGLNIIRIE